MKMLKLLPAALLLPFSCTTVPEDAPHEFHEAQAAIEAMDDADAESTMPKTADYAENTFDDALDTLEAANDDDNTEGATVQRATEKAVAARDAARNVTTIDSKLQVWDENRGTFENALARLDDKNQDSSTAMAIISEPTSPLAKLAGSELVSTVAYFGTNESDKAKINDREMEAMVGILEKDDRYHVTLTGFADHRGDSELNKKLSKQRADRVASILKEKGISQDRIDIKASGEEGVSFEDTQNQGELQLDRRVEAMIVLEGA